MDKIIYSWRNLSLRKSLIVYVVIFVIFAFTISVMTAFFCNSIVNVIKSSYPLSGEKYYLTNEQGEQLGDGTYISNTEILLSEQDEHMIDLLELVPAFATPIYSALCMVTAIL